VNTTHSSFTNIECQFQVPILAVTVGESRLDLKFISRCAAFLHRGAHQIPMKGWGVGAVGAALRQMCAVSAQLLQWTAAQAQQAEADRRAVAHCTAPQDRPRGGGGGEGLVTAEKSVGRVIRDTPHRGSCPIIERRSTIRSFGMIERYACMHLAQPGSPRWMRSSDWIPPAAAVRPVAKVTSLEARVEEPPTDVVESKAPTGPDPARPVRNVHTTDFH